MRILCFCFCFSFHLFLCFMYSYETERDNGLPCFLFNCCRHWTLRRHVCLSELQRCRDLHGLTVINAVMGLRRTMLKTNQIKTIMLLISIHQGHHSRVKNWNNLLVLMGGRCPRRGARGSSLFGCVASVPVQRPYCSMRMMTFHMETREAFTLFTAQPQANVSPGLLDPCSHSSAGPDAH